MKTPRSLAALVVLLVAPCPCFALWEIESVSLERAKQLSMEVRATAGPKQIRVELEFKIAGELKDFSHVDLRIGMGDNPTITAPLKEDRSKKGRVVVSFTADRGQLDKLNLWVMVPGMLGGTIYDLRVSAFVPNEKKGD